VLNPELQHTHQELKWIVTATAATATAARTAEGENR
jgi:hypothetical protein